MCIGVGLRKRDTSTWIEHALIAAFGSFVGGAVNASLGFAVVTAWFLAGYFVLVREVRDEARHREDGDWDTPSPQGVTPRIDQWGDLLGPVAVAVTYTLAWVLA